MSGAAVEALRRGGKLALARAIAEVERAPFAGGTLDLLDEAYRAARGHVVGLTGPPGVGKSTLLSALVRASRARGRSVGVIAVDPSSRRSGGALLGDRTRLELDPEDHGVFVRSMAARDRLGGLAELAAAGVTLLRAVFDLVLVETVGVGQSETGVRDLADTVVLAVQPGAGDALQFMKAGIVEIPDLAVVTKADLGPLADKAARDLAHALRLARPPDEDWTPTVLTVSAAHGSGIDGLVGELERHARWLGQESRLERRRRRQARAWVEQMVREEYGRRGLAAVEALGESLAADAASPFRTLGRVVGRLRLRCDGEG